MVAMLTFSSICSAETRSKSIPTLPYNALSHSFYYSSRQTNFSLHHSCINITQRLVFVHLHFCNSATHSPFNKLTILVLPYQSISNITTNTQSWKLYYPYPSITSLPTIKPRSAKDSVKSKVFLRKSVYQRLQNHQQRNVAA